MATSKPSGNRSKSLVMSMARLRRALPSTERCERPSRAASSAESVQPGRLEQGPHEKLGLAGRRLGFAGAAVAVMAML